MLPNVWINGGEKLKPKIRTKDLQRGIKVLDRTIAGADHIKRSHDRTKEFVESACGQDYGSPEAYAQDQMVERGKRVISDIPYQTDRAVRTARKAGKKIKKYKDKRENPVLERTVKDLQKERTLEKSMDKKEGKRKSIKTAEEVEKAEKISETRKKGKDIRTAEKELKVLEQQRLQENVSEKMRSRTKQKHMAEKLKRTKDTVKRKVRNLKQLLRKVAGAVSKALRALAEGTKALIAACGIGGSIAIFILLLVIVFGGALCMIGGDNSSTVLPVSEEVEAYEPVIRQYAARHGISEYVELIKAIMMQESGGRGLDPMQSSESGYNTRFPRQPDGITDPEYSIECGVKAIKNCLEQAKVENPMDMERIKLCLQGYNFGNGYISWAKNNYGGYSLSNAEEFSKMMAERMGWDSYGDTKYVPHVLRYYVFGRTPFGIGDQMIIAVAETQLGNIGGEPYWRWYGFDSRVEWCACFVSWCADQCGYIDSGLVPKFAKCSVGAKWFQNQRRFLDGSGVPVAGSIIFFDWGDDGSVNHVGIVKKVEKGTVYTIEGNSGNKCRERSYVIGDNRIYGYGLLVY